MPTSTIVDVQILVAPRHRTHGELRYTVRTLAGGAELIECREAELGRHVGMLEDEHQPRWVFPATSRVYPVLLRSGVRLRRSHDLELTEGILLAAAGRAGEPRSLAAAYARAQGHPAPPHSDEFIDTGEQEALFDARDTGLPHGISAIEAAEVVLRAQEKAIANDRDPERMRLLVASESASALAAAEMSHHGLPWRADEHRELLRTVLGPRVAVGRPRTLAALAERISAAFGGQPVNPDYPASVLRAFRRAGIELQSTRAWVLRGVDHPAVEPLLAYKELSRLLAAHGWSWLDTWVANDRFKPVFVVGGVVSGRWASRGGGALQVPRVLRSCVRADPGWRLVVADAAALEPRVLAALAGDRGLAEVSDSPDLYSSLAEDTFGGDRASAKLAMLSAMYGGTSGEAGSLLAVLRTRFPAAVAYVERAALAGERGELVRSRLGRTSPPPSRQWRALTGQSADDPRARSAARDWGRFTRNFVVQASAADFTAVLLALLRLRLADQAPAAQLVFFLHDEVIVHCPAEVARVVADVLTDSAHEAGRLVFGPRCPVRFPLQSRSVSCYADAR